MIYLEAHILRYIIANMPAALYRHALTLVSTGQCAIAMIHLNLAIYLGHLPSRALKAWMLIHGRKGVAPDNNLAFELVKDGTRLGCHHCQGVMARCYMWGHGIRLDQAQSLKLARKSSGLGSRYGQNTLGVFYHYGIGGVVAHDSAQARALFLLAAAQNLDEAHYMLGNIYRFGDCVAKDYIEGLRLYQLAAAHGHHYAFYCVAECHEQGLGIPKNKAEAIRWYRRAHEAGNHGGRIVLHRLGALE